MVRWISISLEQGKRITTRSGKKNATPYLRVAFFVYENYWREWLNNNVHHGNIDLFSYIRR